MSTLDMGISISKLYQKTIFLACLFTTINQQESLFQLLMQNLDYFVHLMQ